MHFPCFVDAEKRVKKKETSDLTESWIIRYSWFCCPCMRCEMSIIRKMGLWISDVIFFFFFMLHLWAVCQKMPVRPSHFAEGKLNLSQNYNKNNREWTRGFWNNYTAFSSLQNLQSFLKDFYTSAKICTVLKTSDLFILIILQKKVFICVCKFLQRVGLFFFHHFFI